MNSLELILLLIAGLCGGVSVGAAVAASMHYRALRKERAAKQRAHRRSSAIEQLQIWRDQELLVIRDKALESALYWEGANPELLEEMVNFIRTIVTDEDLKPGGKRRLVLSVKETADEEEIEDKHQHVPHGLEVVAAFG